MRYLLLTFLLLSACHSSFKSTFFSKEGIAVQVGSYKVTPEEFEQVVQDTVTRWQRALISSGSKCDLSNKFKSLHVTFLEYPFLLNGRKLAGSTVVQYGEMKVGYLAPLSRSALGHELGHLILYTCDLDYSEPSLSSWAQQYNLPY